MKLYLANATSDWGHIYTTEQIKASNFKVAFSRAGHLAYTRCRRRPKHITISMKLVGTITKDNTIQEKDRFLPEMIVS